MTARKLFAANAAPDLAQVPAVSLRPLAARASGEVERFGYHRAGMTSAEIDSSPCHARPPKRVADLTPGRA